jgi:CheY-specific phosphatase CheX
MSVSSPTEGAFLQSTSLTYELSETCEFGKAVWTWSDGTEDPAEIHTQLMAESELFAGEHDGNLGNRVELIDGAIYHLEINVQDLAGNEGEPVIMENLYYDATSPELAVTAPSNDEIVNHATVSYSLSEELQTAVMEWEAVDGATDISAPHKTGLVGEELSAGKHKDVQLAEIPSLNDGTVYRINFIGIDKSGNVSDTVRVEGIQFDISPPELTIVHPATDDFINTNILSYSISEPLTNGRLIWTATSGDVEPDEHVVPLVFEEMSVGDHPDVKLMQAPRLSDGIVYDLSIFGMDLAGNTSDTITVANLTFDITPPRISIVEPVSGASRNSVAISYKLSEDLIQGTG